MSGAQPMPYSDSTSLEARVAALETELAEHRRALRAKLILETPPAPASVASIAQIEQWAEGIHALAPRLSGTDEQHMRRWGPDAAQARLTATIGAHHKPSGILENIAACRQRVGRDQLSQPAQDAMRAYLRFDSTALPRALNLTEWSP